MREKEKCQYLVRNNRERQYIGEWFYFRINGSYPWKYVILEAKNNKNILKVWSSRQIHENWNVSDKMQGMYRTCALLITMPTNSSIVFNLSNISACVTECENF